MAEFSMFRGTKWSAEPKSTQTQKGLANKQWAHGRTISKRDSGPLHIAVVGVAFCPFSCGHSSVGREQFCVGSLKINNSSYH